MNCSLVEQDLMKLEKALLNEQENKSTILITNVIPEISLK